MASTQMVYTSILKCIKDMLNVPLDDHVFDAELIVYINSAFAHLCQIGVGPIDGFEIEDDSTEWSEYTGDDKMFNMVKTFVFLSVKLIFDPPASSSVQKILEDKLREQEFRLNFYVDPKRMEVS